MRCATVSAVTDMKSKLHLAEDQERMKQRMRRMAKAKVAPVVEELPKEDYAAVEQMLHLARFGRNTAGSGEPQSVLHSTLGERYFGAAI